MDTLVIACCVFIWFEGGLQVIALPTFWSSVVVFFRCFSSRLSAGSKSGHSGPLSGALSSINLTIVGASPRRRRIAISSSKFRNNVSASAECSSWNTFCTFISVSHQFLRISNQSFWEFLRKKILVSDVHLAVSASRTVCYTIQLTSIVIECLPAMHNNESRSGRAYWSAREDFLSWLLIQGECRVPRSTNTWIYNIDAYQKYAISSSRPALNMYAGRVYFTHAYVPYGDVLHAIMLDIRVLGCSFQDGGLRSCFVRLSRGKRCRARLMCEH